MAFIDFAIASATPINIESGIQAERITLLSHQEIAAVELGRSDPLWSIGKEGRAHRLFRAIFSIARPNALANPRLEALRRLTIVAHFGSQGRLAVELGVATSAGVGALTAAAVLSRLGRAPAGTMVAS